MIAVDWGTTNFRAFRLGADGAILDRRTAACGILHVEGAPSPPPCRQRSATGSPAGSATCSYAV